MTDAVTKLTPSDLAALMCARICHDLVSPIGALGSALEVLNDPENEDMHEDAMDLVRLSAGQATHKLKYLRLAFGAGTSAPGVISMDQVKSLVGDMYEGGKAKIIWDTTLDGIEKNQARLLLNMIMIAVQSIPRGGDLTIDVKNSGDANIVMMTAEGPKPRIYEAFTRTLSGKAPEDGFDGRTIQPFYTGMLVRQLKGRIDTMVDDEKAVFTAFLPLQQSQNAA